MSATTASLRNLKPNLVTGNSLHNMTANENETKSTRFYSKKPSSTTNISQEYASTNGSNHHLKKRNVLSHHRYFQKSIPERPIPEDQHQQQQNGHDSNEPVRKMLPHSSSSPIVFHAIAPAPLSEDVAQEPKVSLEKRRRKELVSILHHQCILFMENHFTYLLQ